MSPDELTGLMTRAEILDQLKNDLARPASRTSPWLPFMWTATTCCASTTNTATWPETNSFAWSVKSWRSRPRGLAAASGRIGGDEFLLILPGRPLEQVLALAESIARRGGEPAH